MAAALTRIKGIIQAAADLAEGALQVALGTPGSYIDFPDVEERPWLAAERTATGQAWGSTGVQETILAGIAQDLDLRSTVRADVTTGATSVAPTINESLGVTSITKDEGTDRLTVTFSAAFLSAYFHLTASIIGVAAVPVISSRAVNSVAFSFVDDTGATLDINGRQVTLACLGRM